MPGAVAFFKAADIPGTNVWADGGRGAPLFASDLVEYEGQPVGIIVAETAELARSAAEKVIIDYEEPKVTCIFDCKP